VIVIDDYAHHPTEVKATLSSARTRYPEAVIWAVFQPHTYSRTEALLQEFKRSFSDADHVVVLDVFGAREQPVPGLDGAFIADQIDHPQAQYLPGIEDATTFLINKISPGSVVITLSAGDGNRVGTDLLERLQWDQGV
jgi:UDP-N-acetylmuramate--alanine ligase